MSVHVQNEDDAKADGASSSLIRFSQSLTHLQHNAPVHVEVRCALTPLIIGVDVRVSTGPPEFAAHEVIAVIMINLIITTILKIKRSCQFSLSCRASLSSEVL